MITIIDYGLGNVGSIANMIKKVGGHSIITSEIDKIKNAVKLILPGVGAFDAGMKNLQNRNLIDILKQRVISENIPILGICLGMQLFSRKSEEGHLSGLSFVAADTVRFNNLKHNIKIPHMGWNTVSIQKSSRLIQSDLPDQRYYFVHSYHLSCDRAEDILTMTNHGYDFPSAIETSNIFGVQFHPEKSHKFGMHLMGKFVKL